MPKIDRKVPYTLAAYSGGIIKNNDKIQQKMVSTESILGMMEDEPRAESPIDPSMLVTSTLEVDPDAVVFSSEEPDEDKMESNDIPVASASEMFMEDKETSKIRQENLALAKTERYQYFMLINTCHTKFTICACSSFLNL